jgi:NAD(P)-dependent dehydrogenase (short-subunit alcohol dehydrogenase family)
MSEQRKAVVIGVGPLEGLGAALCRRFAASGHQVFAAGRTASALELVASAIREQGGLATPIVTDATVESDVTGLFDAVDAEGGGILDLAIYNVGNNMPGQVREMEAEYFETAWRIGCLGGFLFGREAVRRMAAMGGCLLFTGASASLRGRPGFGAFSAAKGALRNLAQAMAKEHGPDGIHVGHVVVDGGIRGEKLRSRRSERYQALGEEGLVSLEGLADAYQFLYRQPRQAWTFELDLRTSGETW